MIAQGLNIGALFRKNKISFMILFITLNRIENMKMNINEAVPCCVRIAALDMSRTIGGYDAKRF